MIVRPPEYLDDVHERELEMQAAEARLAEIGYHAVPVLRPRGREGVPALPELHAQAEGPVHELRQAAGPDLEDLPVLRDRDRRLDRRRTAPPPQPAARRSRRWSAPPPDRQRSAGNPRTHCTTCARAPARTT